MVHDGRSRVVVLASGTGSTLAALLSAHSSVDYPAQVVGVVGDRESAGALQKAQAAGVATTVVRPTDFADRPAWDDAIAAAVASYEPDLVVLAGFMRVLGAPFVSQFAGRAVNTHPSLLPAFTGAHAVRDALAYGVKVTGCTVHLVDDGLDTGPILAQRVVMVRADDTEDALHERIKVVERELLTEVVARIATGGVHLTGRQAHLPE